MCLWFPATLKPIKSSSSSSSKWMWELKSKLIFHMLSKPVGIFHNGVYIPRLKKSVDWTKRRTAYPSTNVRTGLNTNSWLMKRHNTKLNTSVTFMAYAYFRTTRWLVILPSNSSRVCLTTPSLSSMTIYRKGHFGPWSFDPSCHFGHFFFFFFFFFCCCCFVINSLKDISVPLESF